MIELNKYEKNWIKLCKGHFKDKYPFQGSWVLTLKPLFIEVYGWDPDEDGNYRDYLNCIFNKLLDLHLKILNDQSGTNLQMRGIFEAAFYKSIFRPEPLPIERAIAELCALIQNNIVVENNEPRYTLD